MDVTIKGQHFDRDQKILMVDLARWCGNKLLGPRINKNVELLIRIVNPKTIGINRTYGTSEVHHDDERRYPRSFIITTTNYYGTLRTLMIVAHEMLHVKQYALRELTYCGRTGSARWQGKLIDENIVDY